MMFYRITANTTNLKATGTDDQTKRLFDELRDRAEKYDSRGADYLFLSNFIHNHVTAGAIIQSGKPLPALYTEFFRTLGIEFADPEVEEIKGKRMVDMLGDAEDRNLIRAANDVLERFSGLDLFMRTRSKPSERLLEVAPSKDALLQKARDLLCEETLVPELERIYEKPSDGKTPGHPVHYLIQTDSREIAERIVNILLSALYANGRIQSRRYIHDTAEKLSEFSVEYYEISSGGTLVAVIGQTQGVGEYAAKENEIYRLAFHARIRQNDVLTIFCLPRAAEGQKKVLLQQLKNMTLVELREDMVTDEQARAYLAQKAQQKRVPADPTLYQGLQNSQKQFLPAELDKLFVAWFSQRLKTCVYPQYAHLATVSGRLAAEKPQGDAYSELQNLIGLERVKGVIDRVLDYSKAQKLFQERGMDQSRTALHMVFIGNPGSAKTTVARLLARVMRDNQLLSVGSLIEVGRADLVGKYVGWTASLVKETFARATGSVLLIDEAYSLVDDKEGMYGDEAINTIVQEMENLRDDIVVIFAGYPDKMERFLQRNPGLRSRIAFHVPFDDYSPDELCRITALLAARKELTLAPGVADKLLPIFEAAARSDDFGNGRFARNLLEQAQMRQASRLVRMDMEQVTDADVRILLPEDFEAPARKTDKKDRRIGFAV